MFWILYVIPMLCLLLAAYGTIHYAEDVFNDPGIKLESAKVFRVGTPIKDMAKITAAIIGIIAFIPVLNLLVVLAVIYAHHFKK